MILETDDIHLDSDNTINSHQVIIERNGSTREDKVTMGKGLSRNR